jgi:hypothetical protein
VVSERMAADGTRDVYGTVTDTRTWGVQLDGESWYIVPADHPNRSLLEFGSGVHLTVAGSNRITGIQPAYVPEDALTPDDVTLPAAPVGRVRLAARAVALNAAVAWWPQGMSATSPPTLLALAAAFEDWLTRGED